MGIKGKPCKVIDISTSKTGKHGHAKCKFVALNIFTGAKQEDMQPAGHNMSAPLVKKVEYSLMDITDDDYFCMMNEAGDMKEDLQLLEGNEFIGEMHKKIREAFNESKGDHGPCPHVDGPGDDLGLQAHEQGWGHEGRRRYMYSRV